MCMHVCIYACTYVHVCVWYVRNPESEHKCSGLRVIKVLPMSSVADVFVVYLYANCALVRKSLLVFVGLGS